MTTAPSVNDLYSAYRTTPSQENLSRVVGGLKSVIDYSLASVDATRDPLVRSKAMVFTANAVKKFNPEHAGGASLPTFISSQLKQLTRTARASRSPVRIPERVQIDAWQLSNATKQFEDENGREPDLLELADYTSMPVKRIESIRKYAVAIPSETALPMDTAAVESNATDWQSEAVDYVYHDADYIDRKILEYKTGYGGAKIMTPQEIAAKLRLTPSQLSRRSARLSLKIHNLQSALEKV